MFIFTLDIRYNLVFLNFLSFRLNIILYLFNRRRIFNATNQEKEGKPKKTQNKATKRKKNDDESEQNPRKKKANITSKVVRKPEQSPDKMYSSLNIRTSPKNFKAVTGNLKPNQIKWVKEIGLGSILDMKIDTIPSKVAFYVVDNLDINRKAIKTSNGYIKINEDSVTEIFGLKNEGDDIYEIEAGEDADEIKKQWNKQFDNPKMIRQKHIVNLITKSNSVDINFKVNFIILFMNTMINTTKMGICSTNFVSSIGSNFDFKRINWCKYMYDNAMASKFTWESSSTVDFYTGPITFLTLMYLNSTKCLEVSHRRIKPAILEWTSEKMRQREKFEIENSGFGKLDMNTDEVHDALIPERQKTPQEFLANLNQDMDELLIIKAEIEFKMTKAMMLYPKDEGLKEFKAGYEDMFKMNENMIVEVVRPHEESSKEIRLEKEEANQNIHNSSEATIVIDNVLKNINIEELFTEEKETRSEKLGENEDKREEEREVEEKKKQDEEEQKLKALEEKRTEKEENEKKAEEIKTIEETEEHNKSQELKTPQESQKTDVSEETPASCPTFKLGIEGVDTPKPAKKDKSKKGDLVVRLTKKQKLEEKDKDEPQEREKRTEKIGELLKSPYKQRSVDVRSGLYAIEKKIGDWIFSFHGEKL